MRPLVTSILEQAANRERIAAFDQHIGVERARVDDWAGYRRAGKCESFVTPPCC